MIDTDTKEAVVTRWWWVRHAPVPGPRDQIKGRLDLPQRHIRYAHLFRSGRAPAKDAIVYTSSRIRTQQDLGPLW